MTTHQDQANAIKKADQMLSLADLPTYTELHYGKMALEAGAMPMTREEWMATRRAPCPAPKPRRRPGSNPPPPSDMKRPAPPPPPPPREVGFFGETRASIRAREDYQVFMDGYRTGFQSAMEIAVSKK